MKTKKASLLTKLVVLALLIGAATGLLNLRQQILTAQSDLAEAEAQVAAQKQVNADLSDAVENSDDPDRQADIARGKLGLVEPGESIFRSQSSVRSSPCRRASRVWCISQRSPIPMSTM